MSPAYLIIRSNKAIFALVVPVWDYVSWRRRATRFPDIKDESLGRLVRDFWPQRLPEQEAELIKSVRDNYLKRRKEFPEGKDLGAGTRVWQRRRSVASIARHSGITERKGRLLFNTLRWFQPARILELGTSLGLSTLYMALARPESRILTLEGHSGVAQIAEETFRRLGLHNITVIRSSFEEGLGDALAEMGGVDFVFIDGDHRYFSTIRAVDAIVAQAKPPFIIAVDDIRWSGEMKAAWNQIRHNAYLRLNLDLFDLGISFCMNYPVQETLCVRA